MSDRIKGVDGVDVDGFQVKAYVEPDYDPDLSHIGTYKNKLGPKDYPAWDRCVEQVLQEPTDVGVAEREREKKALHWNDREYRYIVSGSGDAETLHLDVKRLEEYERNEWGMTGVVVVVSAKGIELGRDSMWGVESDADDSYILECAKDVLVEALAQAKSKLQELREIPVEVKGQA